MISLWMSVVDIGARELLNQEIRDLSGRSRRPNAHNELLMFVGWEKIAELGGYFYFEDALDDLKVENEEDYFALKGALIAFVLVTGKTLDREFPSRFFSAVEGHFKRHLDLGYFSVNELKEMFKVAVQIPKGKAKFEDLKDIPVDEDYLFKGQEEFKSVSFPYVRLDVVDDVLRAEEAAEQVLNWVYSNEGYVYLEEGVSPNSGFTFDGKVVKPKDMGSLEKEMQNARFLSLRYSEESNSLFIAVEEKNQKTYRLTPLVSLPKEVLQKVAKREIERYLSSGASYSAYVREYSFGGKSLSAIEDGIFSREELITILSHDGTGAKELSYIVKNLFRKQLQKDLKEAEASRKNEVEATNTNEPEL